MAITIKSRFPLLMLLGIIFLASACVSYEQGSPCNEICLKGYNKVNGVLNHLECSCEEEEEYPRHRVPGQRERGRQEGEKEEERGEKHSGKWRPSYEWDEDEEEWRGSRQPQRERGRQQGEKEEERREKHSGKWRPSYEWDEDEEEWRGSHQPQRERGRQQGEKEEERREKHSGKWRPSYEWDEDEEEWRGSRQPQRERGRQQGEKEEERKEKHSGKWRPSYEWDEDEDEEEWRGSRQPQREKGRQQGEKEEERREKHSGKWRPSHEWDEDEREEQQPQRERGRQEGERREKHSGKWKTSYEWDEDEEEWRGSRRHEDPEERARIKYRKERREKQAEKEWEKTDRRRHHGSEEEEEEGSSSESQGPRNPFFFRSNKFQTLFENENGHVRLLQRFDKRSNLFQNLQNYRLVEYRARPHTIFLPHHIDADFILVVLSGKAILTVLNPNDRNSFNLERGDTIKLPAGTTAYVVNQDDNEDLRIADLIIPVNRPGKFQSFGPSTGQNQQSYFRGFSKNILEASFNARYEEIEKILLEEQEPQQWRGHRGKQQSQEADAILKVSREQIQELRRHAKSSSKKSAASYELEPFNLRNRNPIYSNKFGKFFESTPEKNPQLKDLDISVSSVEINEGALLLPHYNSRAVVVLLVNEGKGNLELVGSNNEQQEQEEYEEEQQEQEDEQDQNKRVQRYRASLSKGDVVVIPAGHPVAVKASSDLYLLEFGINAENNQRNFLAGEEDNVISQIERPVKEIAFPGSAEEVDGLLKNQKQSYFANARPEQREEESQKRRGPLSSILATFY